MYMSMMLLKCQWYYQYMYMYMSMMLLKCQWYYQYMYMYMSMMLLKCQWYYQYMYMYMSMMLLTQCQWYYQYMYMYMSMMLLKCQWYYQYMYMYMSMMLLNVNDITNTCTCICPWCYLNVNDITVQKKKIYFFLYFLKEKSCCGKLNSQNKSNKLLTFIALPDKWGKMVISPVREKSKIKLPGGGGGGGGGIILICIFLITSQIYGAKFFKWFVYVYFSNFKLGNISAT